MRLYKAVCAWLEAHAAQMGREGEPAEPHPEGNNFAQAEHAHSFTSEPELHSGYRGTSLNDDDGGVYRLGFQPNRRKQ